MNISVNELKELLTIIIDNKIRETENDNKNANMFVELTDNNITKGNIEESIMSVGENIKKIRTRKNLTQAELASMVGVGQSMIYHIESGRKMPSFMLGVDIAKALGCTVEDLCNKEVN